MQLQEANVKLTGLINLVLENQDFKIINAMNQVLQSRSN